MTSEDPNAENASTPDAAPENAEQPGAPSDPAAGEQLDPATVATTSEQPAADTGAVNPDPAGGSADTGAAATDPTVNTATGQPAARPGPAYTAPTAQQDDDGRSPGGIVAGAAAVVSAVLGAMALLGNPVSNMLREHRQVSGQIDSMGGGGGGGDEIATAYTTPWHTAALSNGIIAVVAVLIGGVTLAAWLHARDTKWAKAVALGGMILGVLGILVSAGMYFDWFATPPEMPKQPQMPGMG